MSITEWLTTLGLPGLFAASFLGHFGIILKEAVFIPVFIYLCNFWDPLTLGLVGGISGGLGELSSYLMGRGITKIAKNKNTVKTPKWAKKLGLLSVLLFSLTPLPDMPVLVLIGSARFPVLGVLALEILGKILLYTIAAALGGALYYNLNGMLPTPYDSALVILISLSFSIIFTWKKTRTPILRETKKIVYKIINVKKKLRKKQVKND